MSYIDDEELKIGISEEEDLEEEIDIEEGFNDPIEDDDLLVDEFKGLEDLE